MVRAALIQMCSGDDPEANLAATLALLGFMRVLRALSVAGSPGGQPGAALPIDPSEEG